MFPFTIRHCHVFCPPCDCARGIKSRARHVPHLRDLSYLRPSFSNRPLQTYKTVDWKVFHLKSANYRCYHRAYYQYLALETREMSKLRVTFSKRWWVNGMQNTVHANRQAGLRKHRTDWMVLDLHLNGAVAWVEAHLCASCASLFSFHQVMKGKGVETHEQTSPRKYVNLTVSSALPDVVYICFSSARFLMNPQATPRQGATDYLNENGR